MEEKIIRDASFDKVGENNANLNQIKRPNIDPNTYRKGSDDIKNYSLKEDQRIDTID